MLALSHDPAVTALACAPGNAGTAAVAESYGVDVADATSVAARAEEWRADLVVIGPEVPLVAGAADAVRQAGIPCFGPAAAAARIEGSKAFAKDVMAAAGVPTAHSEVVDNPAKLDAALNRFGPTWVVKDDGLAAGKGVLVTTDVAAARTHAMTLLDGGHPVLLESFLDGPEASLFCVVDGTTVVPLVPAQDYKRWARTTPVPTRAAWARTPRRPWSRGLRRRGAAKIIEPVLDELADRGTPYRGRPVRRPHVTSGGPQVIEFNCRFGDPETQVVLALLRTPLSGLLNAAATNTLAAHPPLEWHDGYAVTVVIAAEGYPGRARSGDVITGAESHGVLHAGTRRRDDGATVSAGGRVLSVVGTGPSLTEARDDAYRKVGEVHLAGSHHRTDIALRAAKGEVSPP